MLRKYAFWLILFLGTALHVLTLTYSPIHWQDEVQVVEIGRLYFSSSDWSMYWLSALGDANGSIPTTFWGVGAVFAEFGYRLLGEFGPRIITLLALILSTLLVRAYLRPKLDSSWPADALALIYFAAPQLVESVRTARVDVFAFLFLFAGLALLSRASWRYELRFALLGAASALCVLSWPTAVLLLPIVLFEVVALFRRDSTRLAHATKLLFLAALSALIVSVLALLPILGHLADVLSIFRNNVPQSAALDNAIDWKGAAVMMFGPPFLYLAALPCLLPRRDNLLLSLGGFAFLAICLLNRFYTFRVMYFVPYAIIALALTVSASRKPPMRRVMSALSVVLLVCCFGYSVLARNAIEFCTREYRNDSEMCKVLSSLIPSGAKVRADTYLPYFLGRSLGWRQFKSNSDKLEPVGNLGDFDYVIVERGDLTDGYAKELSQAGFTKAAEIPGRSDIKGFLPEKLNALGFLKPLKPIVVFHHQR